MWLGDLNRMFSYLRVVGTFNGRAKLQDHRAMRLRKEGWQRWRHLELSRVSSHNMLPRRQSSLCCGFAVHTNQEVQHQPIYLSRRFLLGPVPNARQQDLLPEIRSALLQVINVGSCELHHGGVCSSHL